ncbi:MAG: mechanosensitive ion channel family protein [Candidatus Marinimicrobia bacterium]|nr:mechanosensitive ion channel family protein [Candidatus Neomarinimicrobiota bacterium]
MTPFSELLADYPLLERGLAWAAVVLLAAVAYGITRYLIRRRLPALVERSATRLDDILLARSVFRRLGYLVPVLVLGAFTSLAGELAPLMERFLAAATALIIIITLGALLGAIDDLMRPSEAARRLGLSSYIQIARLALYLLGGIAVLAILLGRSPLALLSGIGALTAILLLIFRDTLLSFVASLRISSGGLLRMGDWIEMPDFGADGDVIGISLYTVTIQNWDKTISTIPTFKFLDHSFKNWRGMTESGGRRVKRAVYVDMNSVRLCDDKLLDRFGKFELIADYVSSRRREVESYNRDQQVDTSELINGRRMTNLGTFRAYVEAYLTNHPQVRSDMTLMVRQRAPGAHGLPLEIYAFTTDTRWEVYEGIQADIFDHILAVAPEFGLRIFQDPTGADWRRLGPAHQQA